MFFSIHIFVYTCMPLIFSLYLVIFFSPPLPLFIKYLYHGNCRCHDTITSTDVTNSFFRTNLLSSSILFFIFKLQRFCTSLVFLYYLNYIILLLIIASCVVVYVTLPVHYILFLYISFFVRAINIIIQNYYDFSVY